MNTKLKGDIGELIVSFNLLKDNWNISFPYGDNTKYDLIAEKDGEMRRIQVKAVYPKDGVLHINCRSSNNWSSKSYSVKDFEYLVAVDLKSENVYYIPSSKMGKSLFNLRIKSTKNNQKIKINSSGSYLKIK